MGQSKDSSLLEVIFSEAKQTLEAKSISLARRRTLRKWKELGKGMNAVPFKLAELLPRLPETEPIYGNRKYLLLLTTHWCDIAIQRLHGHIRAGKDFTLAFDSITKELLRQILSPGGTWRRVIILSGAHYIGEPVKAAQGVSIEQVDSRQDVEKLIGGQPIDWPFEVELVSRPNWTAIICDEKVSKREHPDTWAPLQFGLTYEQLSNLLLAFRLYSDGDISIAGEVIGSMETIPFCQPIVISSREPSEATWELSPTHFGIELTTPDIQQILNIYHEAKALQGHNTFREAKYRFDRSFDNGRILDAILELTICLEALSLLGTQELIYRISARWAALLALPPDKTGDIYNTIKSMYSIRSVLVHGSSEGLDRHLNMLSQMKQMSPKKVLQVNIRKDSELDLSKDYKRLRRALLSARQVTRLAMRAVLSLAKHKDGRRWPFPQKEPDIDLELVTPTSRDCWRERAGVVDIDFSRLWWSWPAP